MEDIGYFFMLLDNGMSYKFEIYGYLISMKDIFIWSALGVIIARGLYSYIDKNS